MPSDENSREETDYRVLQENESDLVRHSTCAVTLNVSDCFYQDKCEQKRVIDEQRQEVRISKLRWQVTDTTHVHITAFTKRKKLL